MKHRLALGLPLYEDEQTEVKQVFQVAQGYLNSLDLKRSTMQSYRTILNRVWMPTIGAMLISEVRPSHIKQVLADLKVSQKTKRNILYVCNSLFAHALSDRLITANPTDDIKITRHQKPPIERFKPAEKERILTQLSGAPLLYFTILFETGMRPGEVLALRWDDWNGDTIHVNKAIVARRPTTTKTSETRDILVSDILRHALTNAPSRFVGGPLLQNSFGRHHLDTDTFNLAWREALRRAKVRYRIPYTCRHTRASELLTHGIEPAFAAQQMGHTVEMFFRTYAKWIDELRGDEQKNRVLCIGRKIGQGLDKEAKK
jgi:integrase